MQKVYCVFESYNEGQEFVRVLVCVFSKKEDAEKLVELEQSFEINAHCDYQIEAWEVK